MNYSKERCPKSSTYSVHERPSDSEVEDGILGSMIAIVYVQLKSQHTGLILYYVAPPELKISPIKYFVIHNSVVLSKILKIVVPF